MDFSLWVGYMAVFDSPKFEMFIVKIVQIIVETVSLHFLLRIVDRFFSSPEPRAHKVSL